MALHPVWPIYSFSPPDGKISDLIQGFLWDLDGYEIIPAIYGDYLMGTVAGRFPMGGLF
jgi:hypothetical protein